MKKLISLIATFAAYAAALFAQPGGEIKITLPHAVADTYFGKSVALSGTRAIIGAANAAHIFEYDGAAWKQVATLRENEQTQNLYGHRVAIDGDYAVVSGAQAYVYRYDGQRWSQTARLGAKEKSTLVALSDAWAIAGGGKEITFFQRSGETWQEKTNFDPDGHSAGAKAAEVGLKILFGKKARLEPAKSLHDFSAVAISGKHAIAGVWKDSDKAAQSGAVYFYALENGAWKKMKRVKSPEPIQNGFFGADVGIAGDYAIVGAEGNIAAFIYKFDGKEWRLQKTLKVNDVKREDRFGSAVAVNENFAVVGAMDDSDRRKQGGAVYLFQRVGEDWTQQDKFFPNDIFVNDRFGMTVSLSERVLLAGAATKYADVRRGNVGAVYAYDLVEKMHAAALTHFLGLGRSQNPRLANEQFRFTAKAGRPLATMWLAILHARGECDFPKDEALAKTYAAQAPAETQRLAENGSVEAQYLLAEAMLSGASEIRDSARGFELLTSAARLDYLPAIRRLGLAYLQGESAKRNDDEALAWLAVAAQKKAGGIVTEAVRWLESAVENDDLSRSALLGDIYAAGTLVEKNTAKAYEYYRRGALANYPNAMHGFAYFYHNGVHVEKDFQKAEEWYRQAAAQGYTPAMSSLGDLHDEKSNYVEAASWYEKGALAGDIECMNVLGVYYARGTMGAPNGEKALHWFKKAAERGDAEGMASLGMIYFEGVANTPVDKAKGFEWLSKAAAQDFGPALTRMGKLYYNGEYVQRDYAKAREFFERAGGQSDSEATVMMGKMYYLGNGFEKNADIAYRLFERAIKGGYNEPPGVLTYYMMTIMKNTAAYGKINVFGSALSAAWDIVTGNFQRGISKGMQTQAKINAAQNNPRILLRHLPLQAQQLAGIDIAQNPAAGLSPLRSAAAQKDSVALNNLGVLYWNGGVVEPNMIEAVELFVQAADRGNVEAVANLGLLYFDAGAVDFKNYSKALEFLSKAAKAKHVEAMSLMGQCYFDGLGVKKDYAQALTWFSEAATLGHAEAMKNIGYMYATGTGVTQNYAEAHRWFKGAADRGNARAMYNLAVMYLKGTGVEKSYRSSASWAKRAANLGDDDAADLLVCDYCGNSGRATCDECSGRGQVAREGELSYLTWSCSNCSGTGKVQCNAVHLSNY
jgi:hypothetical protein